MPPQLYSCTVCTIWRRAWRVHGGVVRGADLLLSDICRSRISAPVAGFCGVGVLTPYSCTEGLAHPAQRSHKRAHKRAPHKRAN